jgi:hypothetical protein
LYLKDAWPFFYQDIEPDIARYLKPPARHIG